MTFRQKKILITQLVLFLIGISLIFLTYVSKNNSSEKIFTQEIKSEINEKIEKDSSEGSKFYDIEYSGIDLSGNRYILNAKEATNSENDKGLIHLKFVKAVFYFKDNKILNISSNFGLYNNKSLDMTFIDNVKGTYEGSILLAERAEYSNSENYILISENVKIQDIRGTMLAEKLVFDIEKNKLDISSPLDKKVNANLNYK